VRDTDFSLAVLLFFAFMAVGVYATTVVDSVRGGFSLDDLIRATQPLRLFILLPGVLVVTFLLFRALIIELNSTGALEA
jgi:hypothetical protein